MKIVNNFFNSTGHWRRLFSFFALMAFATVSYAQTSSSVRGTVSDTSGTPLSGAQVVVKNESTGFVRTVSTNENGAFVLRNVPVGNGFTVEAGLDQYQPKSYADISFNLGKATELDFALASLSGSEEITLEVISVIGTAIQAQQASAGVGSTFNLSDIESAPAINRNITDILRADPRLYVDEASGDQIQCAGKNPRFNSLTVDGVRLNDSFGLSRNGYPTERIPFSFDAIEQVAAELAPFDVEYGGFTACNINAVTKSGGNEFHGSVFYDYTSDSLRGDKLEGDRIQSGSFDEKRYGFNLGGPILQDKLFFFTAYEKLDGANLFDRGAQGSGAVNEVLVSQAELDEIAQISRDLYQYDPGPIPSTLPNDDEKLLIKVDWNINDQHRAAFNYTYNDGFNIVESDTPSNRIEFQNHLYERGTELESFSAVLYSDWNDRFSTEFRVGKVDVDNRQIPVNGTDFGEIQVRLDNVTVYLGADDSRQSNDLNYSVNDLSFKGYYFTDRHNLTFGLEREDLDVFNLFVQHTETEIRFTGIDNFRAGLPNRIEFNNSPSQNPRDAAADWGYALNTAFIQDEYQVNDSLSIIAGLRYDLYTSSDVPGENPQFTQLYGFSNSTTLDGESLLQPRLAFKWDVNDSTKVQGGVGLYSGGNPNVWLSNNFSGNNINQFGVRGRNFGYTDGSRSLFDSDIVYLQVEDGAPVGPGYGVPSELVDSVSAGTGTNFDLNYLDPDFEIPSEWKIALGMEHVTGADYIWNADLLISKGKDTAIIRRGDLTQVGRNADGYPIYQSNGLNSLELTNSRVGNESLSASVSVSKDHDNGFSWTLGYAYNDAEDVAPMASSVAFSNYNNRAFFDPQEQVLSTSNFNIEHRATLRATYQKAFFGDNLTTISLFGSYNSGRPYSRTINGQGIYNNGVFIVGRRDSVLLPGVRRNGETAPSWAKIDLKIDQEIGGFRDGHKASVFMVIDNLTNLINDDWGILEEVNAPRLSANSDPSVDLSRIGDASRYQIRVGMKYDF